MASLIGAVLLSLCAVYEAPEGGLGNDDRVTADRRRLPLVVVCSLRYLQRYKPRFHPYVTVS